MHTFATLVAAILRGGVRPLEAVWRWQAAHPRPWPRSRTGYANPRVSHLVNRVGFATHSYNCTKPNLGRWLKGSRDLFPHVVQVQTINRCNAACEFCPYPTTVGLEPRRVMDDPTWSKIVAECASEPDMVTLVPMSKNEPTLDSALESRIAEFAALRQPHQIIELVSNGSTLTPQRVEALASVGLDLLTISVNAADQATYRRVMKGLSWDRVTAHLDALAAADLPTLNVYVRFVKDLTNRREMKAFRRRWRRLNLFGFNVNNRGGAVEDFEALHVRYSRGFEWLRRQLMQAIYPICPYTFGLVHVLENGDVPSCVNDWHVGEVVGNVNQSSIRAIYNSPRMNEIRSLQRAGRYADIPSCRDCSFHLDFWSASVGSRRPPYAANSHPPMGDSQ